MLVRRLREMNLVASGTYSWCLQYKKGLQLRLKALFCRGQFEIWRRVELLGIRQTTQNWLLPIDGPFEELFSALLFGYVSMPVTRFISLEVGHLIERF